MTPGHAGRWIGQFGQEVHNTTSPSRLFATVLSGTRAIGSVQNNVRTGVAPQKVCQGPTSLGVAVMGYHHQHTAEAWPEFVARVLRHDPVCARVGKRACFERPPVDTLDFRFFLSRSLFNMGIPFHVFQTLLNIAVFFPGTMLFHLLPLESLSHLTITPFVWPLSVTPPLFFPSHPRSLRVLCQRSPITRTDHVQSSLYRPICVEIPLNLFENRTLTD